jgi:hypothetical protein
VPAPRERPVRIASTIFLVLALVCALTGLVIATLVESHAWVVVVSTLFQTLLFAALGLVAHDVEDIRALIERMPAVRDANEPDAPTDPAWNETWRLHDRAQDPD